MKKSELQSAAKELNQKLGFGLDPPIKINQTVDELIAALRKASKLIIWQKHEELNDAFTEETTEILYKITDMTYYVIKKLYDGLPTIVSPAFASNINEEEDFTNIEVIFHKSLTKLEINSVEDLAYKLGMAMRLDSDDKIIFRIHNSY